MRAFAMGLRLVSLIVGLLLEGGLERLPLSLLGGHELMEGLLGVSLLGIVLLQICCHGIVHALEDTLNGRRLRSVITKKMLGNLCRTTAPHLDQAAPRMSPTGVSTVAISSSDKLLWMVVPIIKTAKVPPPDMPTCLKPNSEHCHQEHDHEPSGLVLRQVPACADKLAHDPSANATNPEDLQKELHSNDRDNALKGDVTSLCKFLGDFVEGCSC